MYTFMNQLEKEFPSTIDKISVLVFLMDQNPKCPGRGP